MKRKLFGLSAMFAAILILSSITPLLLVNPVNASNSLYVVEYNPYAGIDWTTILRLKTQLHCHTIQSDGGNYPYTVINQYAALGYDALAISDHNKLTWPWTKWAKYINTASWSMAAIPSEEVSMNNIHFTTPFITTSLNTRTFKNNVQKAFTASVNAGGIPIISHPWLMGFTLTTCDTWTGFQGIEIFNPTEGTQLQPFDFQLWDHLLTDPARTQKHIWGFAVDDSHDTGDKNQGWIIVYSSQKTASSIKASILAGSFIAVVGSTAQISSIIQAGSTLIVNTGLPVVWKANGQQTVGTGNTLDLSTLGPGYTYVRAEINGQIFTQPIFIRQVS